MTAISFERYLDQFVSLPREAQQDLIGLFELKKFEKGEYFATEGTVSTKLGFVRNGILRAFYRNPKGEEYIKLFFQNSSILGAYASLITKSESIIIIECLSNCEVLVCNFQDILDLYQTHQSIESLNRVIAEDFFVKKEKREMSLVMYDASKRYELFQEEYPGLENEIPQYHIASYLGITPTQLSRIRAQR